MSCSFLYLYCQLGLGEWTWMRKPHTNLKSKISQKFFKGYNPTSSGFLVFLGGQKSFCIAQAGIQLKILLPHRHMRPDLKPMVFLNWPTRPSKTVCEGTSPRFNPQRLEGLGKVLNVVMALDVPVGFWGKQVHTWIPDLSLSKSAFQRPTGHFKYSSENSLSVI